jgi:hypothetical protein
VGGRPLGAVQGGRVGAVGRFLGLGRGEVGFVGFLALALGALGFGELVWEERGGRGRGTIVKKKKDRAR